MIDKSLLPAIFYTACYQIVADVFGVKYKKLYRLCLVTKKYMISGGSHRLRTRLQTYK